MYPHPAWHEAAANLQSELDAELRSEAYELFRAETGRTRLSDRTGAKNGRVSITVRGGQVITGYAAADEHKVVGMIALADAPGRLVLVPEWAIVSATGLVPTLHIESWDRTDGWTIAARLRDAADMDEVVAALLSTGTRVAGGVVRVGSDHVDLARGASGVVTVAFTQVDAWYLVD